MAFVTFVFFPDALNDLTLVPTLHIIISSSVQLCQQARHMAVILYLPLTAITLTVRLMLQSWRHTL